MRLKVGDVVQIRNFNQQGIIFKINTKKQHLSISMQNFVMEQVSFDSIKKIESSNRKITPFLHRKKLLPSKSESKKFLEVYSEIDLHRYTVEEALIYIEHWLNSAIYHGMKKAKIIHGLGTGKLKKSIRNYLKKNSKVKIISSSPNDNNGATYIEI